MGVEPILHRLGLVNGIEPLSSLKGPYQTFYHSTTQVGTHYTVSQSV